MGWQRSNEIEHEQEGKTKHKRHSIVILSSVCKLASLSHGTRQCEGEIDFGMRSILVQKTWLRS